jgi:hypothetical protein
MLHSIHIIFAEFSECDDSTLLPIIITPSAVIPSADS